MGDLIGEEVSTGSGSDRVTISTDILCCSHGYVIFSVFKILPKFSPDVSGFGINYEELTE